MKLVAMVRDGHTGLNPRQFVRGGVYPVRFYRFSDGMYVRAAAPAYADLVGSKVVRIGGVSVPYQRLLILAVADLVTVRHRILTRLAHQGEELVEHRVVPGMLVPIREAIASAYSCGQWLPSWQSRNESGS